MIRLMSELQAKEEPTAAELRKRPKQTVTDLMDALEQSVQAAKDARVSRGEVSTIGEKPKLRKTFTLDSEIAEALARVEGSASAYVNQSIAERLERDRVREAQRQYVSAYEAEHGMINPELVAQFDELLA